MRAILAVLVALACAGCGVPPDEPRNDERHAETIPKNGTVHVEASVEPPVILPGQTILLKARLINGAETPFRFQHCDLGQLDDRGEAWSMEVSGPQSGFGLLTSSPAIQVISAFHADAACPADQGAQMRALEPGGVATWSQEWGRFEDPYPGAYTFKASFHGLSDQQPFTISSGSGEGTPELNVSVSQATIQAGETLTLRANVSNPTSRYFRYVDDYCGHTIAVEVLGPNGTRIVDHPFESQSCMAPMVASNLSPGESEETLFVWDGKQYTGSTSGADPGTRVPGHYVILVQFTYLDFAEGARMLETSMNVTVAS